MIVACRPNNQNKWPIYWIKKHYDNIALSEQKVSAYDPPAEKQS